MYSLEATRSLRRGVGTDADPRSSWPGGRATGPLGGELLSGEISLLVSLGYWQEAIERVAEIERPEDMLAPNTGARTCSEPSRSRISRRPPSASQMLEQAAPVGECDRRPPDPQPLRSLLRPGAPCGRGARSGAGCCRGSARIRRMLGRGQPELQARDRGRDRGGSRRWAKRARAIELLQTIEQLAPGEASPFLRAHGLRLRARLSVEDDRGDGADENCRARPRSSAIWSMPFWLAVTLLEHAEWLAAREPAGGGRTAARRGAWDLRSSSGPRPFLERIASLE